MERSPAWFRAASRLPSWLRKENWYASLSVMSVLRLMARLTAVEDALSQAEAVKLSSREAMAVWRESAYAGGAKVKSSLNIDFAPSVVMARPEFQPTSTKTRMVPAPGPFQASSARPTTMPGLFERMPTPAVEDIVTKSPTLMAPFSILTLVGTRPAMAT